MAKCVEITSQPSSLSNLIHNLKIPMRWEYDKCLLSGHLRDLIWVSKSYASNILIKFNVIIFLFKFCSYKIYQSKFMFSVLYNDKIQIGLKCKTFQTFFYFIFEIHFVSSNPNNRFTPILVFSSLSFFFCFKFKYLITCLMKISDYIKL